MKPGDFVRPKKENGVYANTHGKDEVEIKRIKDNHFVCCDCFVNDYGHDPSNWEVVAERFSEEIIMSVLEVRNRNRDVDHDIKQIYGFIETMSLLEGIQGTKISVLGIEDMVKRVVHQTNIIEKELCEILRRIDRDHS